MDPVEHTARYTLHHRKKIESICEPLKELGLEGFYYIHLSESGHMYFVTTHGEATANFYQNKLYLNHPLYRTPKYLGNGGFVGADDPSYDKMQKIISNRFFLDDTYIMIQNHGHACKIFGFAGHSKLRTALELYKIYASRQAELRQFTYYFLEEANDIINKAKLSQVDIARLIGDAFYKKKHDLFFPQQQQFFINNSLCSLPCQQNMAIKLTLEGLNAAEISEEMKLSKRAVQHYLDIVKTKWGCAKKRELIAAGLKHFGIII